uniref:Uncharacterized protein n=1 Tax=Anguilla anguilla TaxID=7936 RepID=A0A0E9QZR2_ANGAN
MRDREKREREISLPKLYQFFLTRPCASNALFVSSD